MFDHCKSAALSRCAFIVFPIVGTAIAAMIPKITSTAISSINVF